MSGDKVISKDAAKSEVDKWLDSLDIDQEKRNDPYVGAVINSIVKSVEKGNLVINDNGTLKQILNDPLGDNGKTSEITYTNRYRIGEYHDKVKKITPGDTIALMIAKLSLLSGHDELVFKKMFKQDWEVAANVTVFF